jgi:hypothetical protein
MSYYFFAATLPVLDLDSPPPMAVKEFLQSCRRHLTAADAEAAEAALTPAAAARCAHPTVRAWHDRETQWRNAIVRQRALRAKRDAGPFLRAQAGGDAAIDAAVAAAFNAASPLEREKALDRVLWKQAEELAGWDPFSATAVIVYGVRLRMAARWAGLSAAAGESRAQAIVGAAPVA